MKVTTYLIKNSLSIIVISFLITAPLDAQLKKENKWKDVGFQQKQKDRILNRTESLPPTSYIANYSGTHLAWIYLAAKNSPPPEGLINVTVHDTAMSFVPADYINIRRPNSEYGNYICTEEEPYPVTWTAYYHYSRDPYLAIRIPNVHKGDTINFAYHNCTQEAYSSIDMGFGILDPDAHCIATCDCGFLSYLLLCGINITPMSFRVSQGDNTLISGSSTSLSIYPNDIAIYFPNIDDSLMTIEVDSARYAKFIYDRGTSIDTIDSPVDSVKYIDAISGKIKFLAAGEKPDKPVPVAICARLMSDPTKVFEDTIVVKGNEILLGETKYYYVKDSGGKYSIEETTDPSNTPGAVTSGVVWDRSSISIKKTGLTNPGKKLGVYWETGKPKPDGSGNLPDYMIRLVGRYWTTDTVYQVELKTNYNSEELKMVIEVTKPENLYTPGQNPAWSTYKFSRDVFNNPINIDDICIYYGGIYGIPPHFLKGQMFKEAGKIVFGSDTCFAPSYRYEPFTIQFSSAWKEDSRYNGGLWVVDTSRIGYEMGNGKGVPYHSNVCDMAYPREAKKVWNIIEENSELVNTGSSKAHKIYGSRNSDGTMNFSQSYTQIYYQYQIYLMYAKMIRWMYYPSTPAKNSREFMIHWLRDSWRGKGAINMVAQTRLASSYGLLQMLYSTAVEKRDMHYPSKDPYISPEDFNITDTNMTYSMNYMKQLLIKYLTISLVEDGNWPHGFEYWFKTYIWPLWNTNNIGDENNIIGRRYSKSVYSFAKKFLPQNK